MSLSETVGSVRKSRRLRWAIPGGVAALVVAGGLVWQPMADASPKLPSISAQQLLANARQANVEGFSGTVQLTSDLGLPQLPSSLTGGQGSQGGPGGGDSDGSYTDLLTGTHTAQVAAAPGGKFRLGLMDQLGQRTVVSDGTQVWTYNSSTRKATHKTLDAKKSTNGSSKKPTTTADPMAKLTPQQFAAQLLKKIDPTTTASVPGTASVAGRTAYLLRLTPKSTDTLVGNVTIAVDSQRWIPLRVAITPKNSTTEALSFGFTSIDLSTPAASTFTFTPPAGSTTVTPNGRSEHGSGWRAHAPRTPNSTPRSSHSAHTAHAKPTVQHLGTGWGEVSVITMPTASTGSTTTSKAPQGQGQELQKYLNTLPQVSGSYGTGRVFSSRLFSVLVLPDSHKVLIGMVPTSVLQADAAKVVR